MAFRPEWQCDDAKNGHDRVAPPPANRLSEDEADQLLDYLERTPEKDVRAALMISYRRWQKRPGDPGARVSRCRRSREGRRGRKVRNRTV